MRSALCPRRENEFQIPFERKGFLERKGRDFGKTVSAALFAGGAHGLATFFKPFFQPFAGEFRHAALRGNENDARDAELGRLFDDPIHFLGRHLRLNERHHHRGLSVVGRLPFDRYEGALPVKGYAARPDAARSVEKHHAFACGKPQGAPRVMSRLGRKFDGAAEVGVGTVNEKAGESHGGERKRKQGQTV